MSSEILRRFDPSRSQLGYWLGEAARPGSFVLWGVHRLRGVVQPGKMVEAWRITAQRHDAMRMNFAADAGKLQGYVREALKHDMRIVEACSLSDAEFADAVRSAFDVPFDLTNDSLLRASLFKRADDDWHLAVSGHHIFADLGGIDVIVHELGAVYEALCEGRALPPLLTARSFADALDDIARFEGSLEESSSLRFFEQHFAGVPTVLDLPTDFGRTGNNAFSLAQVRVPLSAALQARLGAKGTTRTGSRFRYVFSCFAALLARLTDQSEFLLGLPVTSATVDDRFVAGMFVNVVPVRCRVEREDTLESFFARLGTEIGLSLEHRRVPFSAIRTAMGAINEPSRNPVYQVRAALVRAEFVKHLPLASVPDIEWTGSWAGLNVTHSPAMPAPTLGEPLDLSFVVYEGPGETVPVLQYNARLFAPRTMERLAAYLAEILEVGFDEPSKKLRELPVSVGPERGKFGRPAESFRSVSDTFENLAAAMPDAPAVAFGGRRYSYGELRRGTTFVAAALRAHGAGVESRVAVLLTRHATATAAFLGVLRAGAVHVPISPSLPRERLEAVLQAAEPRVFIVDSASVGLVPDGAARIVVDDAIFLATIDEHAGRVREVHPCSAAYVIFTSGSTGQPKGVVVEHAGLSNLISDMPRLGVAVGVRMLQFAATNFDTSVLELCALFVGAQLVVCPEEARRDAGALADLLAKEEVQVAILPPALLGSMPALELPRLHTLIVAGEAWGPEVLRRWGRARRIINSYGPTETTVAVSDQVVAPDEQGPMPIGEPFDGVSLLVVDDELRLTPAGVPGELAIGGVGVARGYLRSPAQTADRFRPDPTAKSAGARLYRSGDLVRQRFDDALSFLGRRDHQVKVRGFRIELGDVENALASLPGVAEAVAVVGAEGTPTHGKLTAFLTAVEGAVLEPRSLREALAQRLPEYMVPAHLVVLPGLPLTPNRKIDRKALAALPIQAASGRTGAMADGATAALLVELLGHQGPLSVDDRFIDLGGDSILAMRFIARAAERGFVIPVRPLLENATLAEIESLATPADTRTVEVDIGARRQAVALGHGPELADAYRTAPFQESLIADRQSSGRALLDQMVFSIDGAIDPSRLERALAICVHRHDAFRTGFARVADGIISLVHRSVSAPLEVLDWRDESNPEGALEKHLAGRATTTFGLERAPLATFSLLRIAPTKSWLTISAHHAIIDGWSIGLLVRELSQTYTILAAEGVVDTSPAPPYRSIAEWSYRQDQKKSAEVWARLVDGARPTRLHRAELKSASERRPELAHYRVDASKVVQIAAFAKRNHATLGLVLQAAWLVALARYTRASDVTTGTTVALRPASVTGVERIAGALINTVPFRSILRPGQAVADWLKSLQATNADIISNAFVPFSEIQKLSGVRTSLTDAFFVFQNTPHPTDDQALAIEVRRAYPALTGVVTLVVVPFPDGTLFVDTWFDAGKFDREAVAELVAEWLGAIERLAASDAATLLGRVLLTEQERSFLLESWNTNEPPRAWDVGLAKLLEATAARIPDRLAVVASDAKLTYAQFAQSVAKLAGALSEMGVRPGDRVGVLLPRTSDLMVSLWAVIWAGAGYVPLDENYPEERLRYLIEDSGVRVVIGYSLPSGIRDVALVAPKSDAAAPIVAAPRSPVPYLIYTSGSTGKPKGVVVAEEAVLNIFEMTDTLVGDAGIWLAVTTFSFDMSALELLWTVTRGFTMVLASDTRDFSGLLRGDVTHLQCTPTLARMATEDASLHDALAKLRYLILGGEAVPVDLGRRLRELTSARIFNQYGPTETTSYCMNFEVLGTEEGSTPIGSPVRGNRIYVGTQEGELLPPGAEGEIFVSGVGVNHGYHDRPELTADRFRPDPFGVVPGARMYCTGDVGRLDGNVLRYLGRTDEQIKIRGYRVEPGEIEALLRRVDGCRDAAVVARSFAQDDVRLVAYVSPVGVPAPEVLKDRLRSSLPAHFVPSEFVYLDEIPRTPNGKTDRRALADVTDVKLTRRTVQALPATPTEHLVLAAWKELFGRDDIGVEDDFFDLGGHSLLAARLLASLRMAAPDRSANTLTLRIVFDNPTVRRLAAALEGLEKSAFGPAVVTASTTAEELEDIESILAELDAGEER